MKSRQTITKQITEATRMAVLQRQNNRSITGVYLTESHIHHYISRGQQGIGYEWNLVALTPDEHRQYHDGGWVYVNGGKRYSHDELTTLMRNHLLKCYEGWTEERCKYHKEWNSYQDYGVSRR